MSPSIVYSFILLCLMTWIKPGLFQQPTCNVPPEQPTCNCNEKVNRQFVDAIKLRHFKCDGTFANTPYSITYPQPMLPKLDTRKQTTIYIFGFPQTMESNATKIMIK
ncbi:PREDICTED: uncharacterized protein LOC105454304, partial [Wasmannia auropunctata]|uniref:uncharacterized protein LOC105454304 n=1 Tax=Wasmannia auropunctata TaxID=64793 RepID=UPI0005EF17E6